MSFADVIDFQPNIN